MFNKVLDESNVSRFSAETCSKFILVISDLREDRTERIQNQSDWRDVVMLTLQSMVELLQLHQSTADINITFIYINITFIKANLISIFNPCSTVAENGHRSKNYKVTANMKAPTEEDYGGLFLDSRSGLEFTFCSAVMNRTKNIFKYFLNAALFLLTAVECSFVNRILGWLIN